MLSMVQQYQIVPHQSEGLLDKLPNVNMNLARFIHLMGEFLIEDDKDDIFKTVYYGDKGHYYHGEQHPDHPGFLHHYMVGGGMIMVSQVLGGISIVKEMQYSFKTAGDIDIDNIPLPSGRRPGNNNRVIPLPPGRVHEVPKKQSQLPKPKKTYQDFMAEVNAI